MIAASASKAEEAAKDCDDQAVHFEGCTTSTQPSGCNEIYTSQDRGDWDESNFQPSVHIQNVGPFSSTVHQPTVAQALYL